MNLSQLYYFRKLAQLQHYTKAAKELFITQPTLSDSIACLERELGTPLFCKEGRNVRLTKCGEEFNYYVTSALSQLERGIAQMKEKSGQISGTIDIGCIPTLLSDFLPEITQHYLQTNPKTKFNIYHSMSMEVAAGVENGTFDLGFCSYVENHPNLVYVPVLSQPLIALVNRAHPLAERQKVELKDLIDYEVITYRDTIPIGKTVKSVLRGSGIDATFAFDDEISIGGIISTNSLVAITAFTPFLKQFDNLVKIEITDISPDARLLYLVYNKKNFITSATEAFIDFIALNEVRLPKTQ